MGIGLVGSAQFNLGYLLEISGATAIAMDLFDKSTHNSHNS